MEKDVGDTDSSEELEDYSGSEEINSDGESDTRSYLSSSSVLGGEVLDDDYNGGNDDSSSYTEEVDEKNLHLARTPTRKQKRLFKFRMPFSTSFANLGGLSTLNSLHFPTPLGSSTPVSDLTYQDTTTTLGAEHKLYQNPRLRVNPRMDALKKSLLPNYLSEDHHPMRHVPKFDGNVVVLGGYRGSILRDRKTGRQVWFPIKVGLRMRKVNLEIGLTDEDELNAASTTYADRMLTHVGPIDIARKLIHSLRARNEGCHVHEFAYDWRRSNDLSGEELYKFLKKLGKDSNGKGTIVIAHSMGGLVAQHAVHLAMRNGEKSLIRGVVFAGTPFGCPQILFPLRFGDSIMLAKNVLTARINFTMRCSFSFLPLDGKCFCNADDPDEEYILDFFNVKTWVKYNLSPCVSVNETFRRTQTVEADDPPLERYRATRYLERSLKRNREFLESLKPQFSPDEYPPMAMVYSSSIPTAHGVLVKDREDIKTTSFDNLLYGAGDGVVYRRTLFPVAAGYDGPEWSIPTFRSDYGHVGLLCDRMVCKAVASILEREGHSERELFPPVPGFSLRLSPMLRASSSLFHMDKSSDDDSEASRDAASARSMSDPLSSSSSDDNLRPIKSDPEKRRKDSPGDHGAFSDFGWPSLKGFSRSVSNPLKRSSSVKHRNHHHEHVA